MLVLSRRREETIHIGDLICLKIVKVTDQTVRIGIEAPKLLKILRGEHLTDEDRQQRAALVEHLDSLNALRMADTDSILRCLGLDSATDTTTGEVIAQIPSEPSSPVEALPVEAAHAACYVDSSTAPLSAYMPAK